MMEYQDQLKLQAYLDGELGEAETREMASRLARDQGALALLTELRQTRKAVAGFEDGIRVPESREFFWSKIARQIERESPPALEPEPTVPWSVRLRRLLVPAAGLAVLAIVGLLASRELGFTGGMHGYETALVDAGTFTYHDYANGATLVWLPYPADNGATDPGEPDPFE